MKNTYIRPIEDFKLHLKKLKDTKKTFKVSYSGNVYTIQYGKNKFVYSKKIDETNKDVVHCSRLVRNDVKNAMKLGLVTNKSIPQFPVLVKNFDVFEKYNTWFGFDIEACYWNIAYSNVPFLSIKTYIDFYEKKDVRNIALGTLGKHEIVEEYTNGTMISKKKIDSEYLNIYKQVRYKAYEFYINIMKICNEGVAFYKIDEYLIPDMFADKVLRYLKSQNVVPKPTSFSFYNVLNSKEVSLQNIITENVVYLK